MRQKMEILVNEELLKDKLSNYRELCPVILDVFIWRKDVYPVILGGIVTFLFGLIWYTDVSFITTFSFLALGATLADFVGPLLYTQAVKSEESNWNSEKEKKFCILTNRICYVSVLLWNGSVSLEEWKKERPNMYSACLIVSLLLLAWIGNAVNNLLLAYFFVLFMVLLPGLLHRRILQTYVGRVVVFIGNLLGIKPKKA